MIPDEEILRADTIGQFDLCDDEPRPTHINKEVKDWKRQDIKKSATWKLKSAMIKTSSNFRTEEWKWKTTERGFSTNQLSALKFKRGESLRVDQPQQSLHTGVKEQEVIGI